MEDPIVQEIRVARAAYAAQFGGDIATMVKDLQERQKRGKRKLVELTPRKAKRRTVTPTR
jgi:hypothetical protein